MTAPRLGPGGTIAGKYTVRSLLGDGGSVITYACVSQQGQEVAVKLYDPAVAGHAAVMKALEQAYAATNALPANSSAPIIDAGYDQATVAPYSVTEFLRLPSLLSQQRRFLPEEVVSLLKGLARSLDLAHLRQVVHGALKPSNVFVGPNANPTIVTDFAANLPKAAIPTAEGYALSAPWIAPEQAQSGQVSPAVDVFSTALVAFFALTGRSYWRSCQGPSLDLAGWQQELSGPRSPASARAAEMGVPLSPTMDMVLFRALNVDPKERYRSIGEFASLLEESMRQQVGSAATMALPLVGDAPSPLPANLQKPSPNSGLGPSPNAGLGMQAPALGGVGAATMALPLSAIMPGGMDPRPVPPAPPPPNAGFSPPPNAGFDPRMSQSNVPRTQIGMPMPGPPPGEMPHTGGATVLGMQLPPGMSQGGGQGGGMGAMGQSGGWQQAQPNQYGQQQGYGDPGYPPPPGPNGLTQVPAQRAKKSKAIPIIIALTAVAILAGVAAIVVTKMGNDASTASPDGSGAVASNSAPGGTTEPVKTADPPPKQTATSETTGGASSATPSPSASATTDEPELVDVKIACKPECDAVSIDGKQVDAKEPLHLEPGKHKVAISKKGYVPVNETIEVKAGGFEKTYTLNEMPPQVVRPPPCRPTFGKPCPR